MKLLLSLNICILLTSQIALADQGNPIEQSFENKKFSEGLDELDKATGQKWSQLEDWQKKSSWIDEQVRLGIVGVVYQKGMFGATVSRNIVPDKDSGYLTVDTVNIPAGPLLEIANLAGNIFFQEVFPFLQTQVVYDRTYVNVRHADSYREALTSDPFKFKKIPVTTEGFDKFSNGEVISTMTTGGVYVRAGADLFKLMGVSIADDGINLGPAAKVQVYKQFKMTMAKSKANEILVLVEKSWDKGVGVGLSLGITFNDIIDAPIAIGINQGEGYSPIRINYKVNQDNVDGIIYRINTDSPSGRDAYQRLIQRDLTALDDLADNNNPDVVRELIRNGVSNRSEFNMGLDLLFYRSGLRNIFVNAKYNSTIANGKKFDYQELTAEKVKEQNSWQGDEKRDESYSALVPLTGENADSFIVDTKFDYSDSDTEGKELREIVKHLRQVANDLPVNFGIEDQKNYGQVRAFLAVRFPPESVKTILNSKETAVWRAIGISMGLADPNQWASAEGRKTEDERESRAIKSGSKIIELLSKINKKKSNSDRAKLLIKHLRDNNQNKLFHRAMIELAGRDQIFMHGGIKNLYVNKLKPKKEPKAQTAPTN